MTITMDILLKYREHMSDKTRKVIKLQDRAKEGLIVRYQSIRMLNKTDYLNKNVKTSHGAIFKHTGSGGSF